MHHWQALFEQYVRSMRGAESEVARAVAARAAMETCRADATAQPGIADEAVRAVDMALAAAVEVRQRAVVPYSSFRVGAAVLDADGRYAVGANVEISSYGLTLCAERAALAAACSMGLSHIVLVAVVADTPEPISPCGACRQWIVELAPHALVAAGTLDGKRRWFTAAELLPAAFGPAMLHIG